MYGALRFLYNSLNLIPDSDAITPSSQATGIVGGTEKTVGMGTATMFAVGSFSGTSSLTYTVQIDDVSAGQDIGNATFRWKTSATATGTWEASAQTTATSLTTLSNGVQIAFIAGTGDDFELWDTWEFEASAIYRKSNLLDLNRHRVWRSANFEDENLLSNGDMEEGFTSGLADDWTKVGASQTFAEETTTVHTSQSLLIFMMEVSMMVVKQEALLWRVMVPFFWQTMVMAYGLIHMMAHHLPTLPILMMVVGHKM